MKWLCTSVSVDFMKEKFSEMMRGQTMRGIIERLRKLEQIAPDKLVILADFDGVEKQCTVDELEASPNASFIRVISGNSLDDVQRILNRIERIAYEQANN